MLAPGESRITTQVVKVGGEGEFDRGLSPGEFEAEFVYYANSKKVQPGLNEDLVTNTVKFSVKE